MAKRSALRNLALAAAALLAAGGLGVTQTAPAQAARDALRVCADPNNLPFSNQQREGFENKIAELIAGDMGLSTEYTWFPQRMGFIRNTLKAKTEGTDGRYKCDLVMGVSPDFEMGVATRPYYHSTYALVYVKGHGLDGVHSQQDLLNLPADQLHKLRIGTFTNSPSVDWLLRHGLIDQTRFFQIMSGDPDYYPGKLVKENLVSGDIDVAILWGPIAGYFASHEPEAPMAVIPMQNEAGIVFDFSISMGVRHGERAWKEQVEQLITRNRERIDAILASYQVPLLPEAPPRRGGGHDD